MRADKLEELLALAAGDVHRARRAERIGTSLAWALWALLALLIGTTLGGWAVRLVQDGHDRASVLLAAALVAAVPVLTWRARPLAAIGADVAAGVSAAETRAVETLGDVLAQAFGLYLVGDPDLDDFTGTGVDVCRADASGTRVLLDLSSGQPAVRFVPTRYASEPLGQA